MCCCSKLVLKAPSNELPITTRKSQCRPFDTYSCTGAHVQDSRAQHFLRIIQVYTCAAYASWRAGRKCANAAFVRNAYGAFNFGTGLNRGGREFATHGRWRRFETAPRATSPTLAQKSAGAPMISPDVYGADLRAAQSGRSMAFAGGRNNSGAANGSCAEAKLAFPNRRHRHRAPSAHMAAKSSAFYSTSRGEMGRPPRAIPSVRFSRRRV